VKYVAAAPNGSVTIRGANGAMLRLRAGATARVINEPPPAYTTPHYHMYAMILKDAHVVATPRSTGRSCGTTDHAPGDRLHRVANGRIVSSSVDIDCSNSHWP